MKKTIYLFLFDGFSDWEISYLTPELFKSSRYKLTYFSISGEPVTSAGGMKVAPDISIQEVDIKKLAILILPGGEAWEKQGLQEIYELLHKVKAVDFPVAGICGATIGLANAGLLDKVNHTSNGKSYLKSMSQNYTGEDLYLEQQAVADKNVITASGIAPIEFAREVFSTLKIFDDATIEEWFQLFKNGIREE